MAEVVHRSLELPGYWRIASFGKLDAVPNPTLPDLRIKVYLGEVSEPISHGKIDPPLRSALVPVGELARLHLNAILLDGQLISGQIQKLEFEQRGAFILDTDRNNLCVFDRFHADQAGLIIPATQHTDSSDPEKNSLFVGIGKGSDPYAFIIPAVEVFRFFYASSDVLTKAFLSDKILDPDTHLWSPKSTFMDTLGRAVIWLRRRMLDADARFLARFAFDEFALKEAQQIFLSAAAWSKPANERMIRALPPFQDRNTYTVLYQKLSGSNSRVLISRILCCDWVPPFKELKWDRDNDGRKDDDNLHERKSIGWMHKGKPCAHQYGARHGLSPNAPAGNTVPFRLEESEITERFPNLGSVPANKMPQGDTQYKSEPRHWSIIYKEAYEGSVAEGQSSQDYIGKTIISALELRNEVLKEAANDVDQKLGEAEYLNILNLLKDINTHQLAEVSFIRALPSYALVRDIEFNVYPLNIDDKPKAWLYIDVNKKNRRMALLAQVISNGFSRYVLELQQRKPKECSTLVVWDPGGKQISSGALSILLMDCAKVSKAQLSSGDSMGVAWSRLEHTTRSGGVEEAQHYLKRIFAARALSKRQ